MTLSNCNCHVCGSGDLAVVEGSGQFAAVSSDIRVVSGTPRLALCPACGILQKPVDEPWQTAVAGIYQEYNINHQSGGSDPVIFTSLYGPGPRADILVAHLSRAASLPERGSMLDIGCASGNILRSFNKAYPRWSLFGMETSDQWRGSVSALAGVQNFFTSLDALGELRLDLIVMSHVLEHIPDPARYLQRLHRHLNPGGVLFVAVPDVRQNPLDLFVLDHCAHFDEETLGEVLSRAEFEPVLLQSDILGKEITAISRASGTAWVADSATTPYRLPLHQVVRDYLTLCKALVERALQLRLEHASFGIMGTSTAAAWIAGSLDMQVDFYVDEDPQRTGRFMFGKPTLSPSQVPAGACVFIPMSMETARSIIARAHRPDIHFHYLSWNQIGEASARVSEVCAPAGRRSRSAG
jgi:trans-aconitate methyltransferase